jgi:hypothetical protein
MNLTTEEIDSIEHAAYDAEVSLRSYSGRMMFGQSCPAIAVKSINNLAAFFVSLGANDSVLAAKLSRELRMDQLGLGEIAYWPSISLPADWEETDADDED